MWRRTGASQVLADSVLTQVGVRPVNAQRESKSGSVRSMLVPEQSREEMLDYLLQLAVLRISSSRKEGVAEHDIVHALGGWVVEHVRVDKEEDGQVDLLSREQLLFLEAEAFNFGKVRCNLSFVTHMTSCRMR